MADQTIVLLSNRELEKMCSVRHLIVELLSYIESFIQPGVSTLELNDVVEVWTQKSGAVLKN